MYFSIIIPVYNRPDEINELLQSLVTLNFKKPFEVVIVEDGSTETCKHVVALFTNKLSVSYYYKNNSGPGDSRNFGMQKANGDYFIIFDSDCIIPANYLSEVEKELDTKYIDCFGGPDKALKSFSRIQKAINFSMTSFLTTGGIRGGSEKLTKFQPRSFNMGISKKAFLDSNGFGTIHPGEDPDLSIRLWKLGYKTKLFKDAFVYHKRRIDWEKFSLQVTKFGKARPILNKWYPEFSKITFWLPSIFVIGFIFSFIALLFLYEIFLQIYFAYFILIFIVSSSINKSIIIGYLSVIATVRQFFGYGIGFLTSYFKVSILKQKPENAFPELFFKKNATFEEAINLENKIELDSNLENKSNVILESKPKSGTIEIQEKSIPKPFLKTKIIGLTGGIGSGKTTVANYIKSIGIPIYISDIEAKKVMEFPEISLKIATTFGSELVLSNQLNREKLASIVFTSPEKLKQLNAIVHPAVKKHFEKWLENNKNSQYVVKEAAILFESGSYKDCDIIITVVAPLESRIERLLTRDNTSREKILQRINNQITDEERVAKSDYVITNEKQDEIKNQVDKIIKLLKNK